MIGSPSCRGGCLLAVAQLGGPVWVVQTAKSTTSSEKPGTVTCRCPSDKVRRIVSVSLSLLMVMDTAFMRCCSGRALGDRTKAH
jgi:hypothetical protein